MATECAVLRLSIIFGPSARQIVHIELQVEAPCTVGEALAQSGVLHHLPAGFELQRHVGIWGRKVELNHLVHDRDRVEIYRDLRVDPKVARRERFIKQGARSAGLFRQRRVNAKAGY
jgi:putative ubiquitin-RnfH superfamily antitoxin RatB of RatAB toxin-antitoxin module